MVLYYSCTDITVEDAIRTGNMDALKMLTASPGVTRIDNIYDLLWLSIITGQKGRIDVFEYVYILCCDSNDNTENMFIEVMRSNSPRCIQAAIDTDLFVHFTKMYVYAYTKKMYIATQILEKMFEDSKDLYKFYRLMCAAKQFQSLDFIENVLKKYDSFTRTNFIDTINTSVSLVEYYYQQGELTTDDIRNICVDAYNRNDTSMVKWMVKNHLVDISQ